MTQLGPIQRILLISSLFALSICFFSIKGKAQWTTQSGTNNIYNTNTGNVGIGFSSPVQALSVGGGINVDASGLFKGDVYTNPAAWLMFGSGSGEGIASNRSSTVPNQFGLNFYTSFTLRMAMTQSGNIGIGTPNPTHKLSVAGGIRLDDGDTFNGANLTGPNTLAWLSFGQPGTGEGIGSNRPATAANPTGLDFYTGYTPRMSITRSGNVLIGKTSQTNTSYMLDVAGNVRASKLIVNTTGADFVFDSTYRLASLSEVESYIKAEHHLSGIEPAAKMEKNGLNVGDNQTMLLKKIEELTLYVIELNKKNELLQQQMEELKRRKN